MTEKLLKMMQDKGYFNQHKKILLIINNDKNRSMKKRIYVIGQRNIRFLSTTVPSQESFQKMPPAPFDMSFLREL